ncbi:MAG: CAP domain-containing protein [Flavobacterium sp.]
MKAKMLKAFLPVALVLFLTSCSSEESSELELAKVETYLYNDVEMDMMSRINHYRDEMGLPILEPIEHISFKSSEHNDFMIQNEVVGHHRFELRSQNIRQVLGAVRVSENIAYNYNTNNAALNAWINSDGHRDNILGDYTHFGISIKTNPANGRKYYTNIFMKR